MSETFDHIDPQELPKEWRKALNLRPGQKVRVTIEAERQRKTFDVEAFKRVVNEIRELPVLDSRSPDDILGYDENGLPS